MYGLSFDSLRSRRFCVPVPVGAKFSALVHAGPRALSLLNSGQRSPFSGVKRLGRGVDHTRPHLAPRLKGRAIAPIPLFTACYRVKFIRCYCPSLNALIIPVKGLLQFNDYCQRHRIREKRNALMVHLCIILPLWASSKCNLSNSSENIS